MQSLDDEREYEFWLAVSSFAYVGHLKEGRGAVLIKQYTREPLTGANIEHHLMYVPLEVARRTLARPRIELVEEYDPEEEAVMMVLDTFGNANFLLLTEDNLGLAPIEAYMNGIEQGASAFTHGQLLQLKEPFDEVRPGYYVFAGRKDGMLHVDRAERTASGDFVRHGGACRLHVDFELLFEPVVGVVVV